jgi:tetratricopeptide (TPR) repeat protein
VNNFDKAQQVNQSVIDKWPKTTSAMNAQLGIVKVHFAKDDLPTADTALDTLIADYKDTYLTELSQAVLDTGEAYWKKGLLYSIEIGRQYNKTHIFNTPQSFAAMRKARVGGIAGKEISKALITWEKLIAIMPDSSMADWNYHLAAECYNYCDEYSKAIEYYQKVLDKWPKFTHAWIDQHKIISIYERMEFDGIISKTEAESAIYEGYTNLIKQYPDCSLVPMAQKWLNNYNGKKS